MNKSKKLKVALNDFLASEGTPKNYLSLFIEVRNSVAPGDGLLWDSVLKILERSLTTTEGIKDLADTIKSKNPGMRYGQSIFIAASKLHERIILKLCGSEIDPFHVDDNVDKFLEEIKNQILPLKVGDKVRFQPEYYSENKWSNGIVKEVIDELRVRAVFHCADDWDNYKNYTSQLTDIKDLKKGWRE